MTFRFVWVGKPFTTLVEHKKAAWGGMPKAYVMTQPGPLRKLWRPVQIQKRKAS